MQTTGSLEYVCILQPFVILIFSNVVQVTEGQSVKVMLGPIREEQKTGTYVGNIASATSISREVSQAEFSTLRFDFLDPSDKWTHLFSINGRSGALFTQTMIDREILCDDMKDCIIKFDVTVNSDVTDFLRIVEVSINVTDINDNMPAFESDEITIDIPENNAVGVTKQLPSAVDKDKGENSVRNYTLVGASDPFTLNVERRLNNKFLLSLVVNSALDREKQDRYKLLLTAADGGQQALTGTLTVFVNVTDVNDNSPQFTQQHYSFSVGETAGVGDVLGKLSATDRDVGKNAEIRYALIFQGKENRGRALFAIDQFTGEITIKAPLQYDAGKSFEAIVEAKDQGDMPRVSEATLMLSIVNVGNNAPRLEVKLQKTVFENTVLIPEDAKNSTFVGKLTAVDNDPGASGIVTCSSRHPSFRTDHYGGYYAIIMNGSLDREVAEKIDVPLVCQDAGSPPKTASITFQVIVSDINDNAPMFSQTQYIANVTEENIVGKQILQLTAEDPDAGINKMFTYSLFPKENSVFSIDKDSGILKARTTFDHEVEKRLNVIILATDEGHPSLVSTATVIVNILDINDNYPEIVTRELRVPEGGGRMKFVGKLEGSDKDSGLNSEMVFSMPPTDDITSQMFKVNPNGVVIALQELDRESRDKYILHLEVRDKGLDPKMTSGTVTVIVEDINDHAPVFQYPNQNNHTIVFLWSMPVNKEITRVLATDRDLGDNKLISYSIIDGNRGDLFGLDKTSGILFLQRRIKDKDGHDHKLLISAHDSGLGQKETHAEFRVIIDVTNATFSAVGDGGGDSGGDGGGDEKYILLAGIIAGVTLLFSVIVLLAIFLIRRGNSRRPSSPVDKHAEWQVVKTGIQEECGKGEVEKINWRGSDIDADVKDAEENGIGGNYIPHSPPDVTKTGSYDTIKKTVDGCPPWNNARDGVLAGQSEPGLGVDPYRKQDFYTFCKVRVNPHDDVNSVTSGETTTSDSGRGGSEDDIPLPPIVECSPELYSNHSSPKQEVEYRPITSVPSNSMSRQPMKADFKTMPSLSSFRNPDIKLYPVKSSFHPLGGDSSNSHTYHGYKNDKHDYSPRSGTAYTSLTQVPQSKTVGPNRHVTFHSNQDRLAQSQKEEKIQEQNRRSPFPAGYENLVPELGGLYVSLPRIGDDDDGNTTTSGSYTIDSDHLNDSIISA